MNGTKAVHTRAMPFTPKMTTKATQMAMTVPVNACGIW